MVINPRAARGIPYLKNCSHHCLWNPDTKQYYASANPNYIKKLLYDKRKRQHKVKSSAFSHLDLSTVNDATTLPCLQPRIAFRDVTRSTEMRTLITALIPGKAVTVHKAPYVFLTDASDRDTAYILGVLSSMILDWLVRRVVELNLGFYLFNNLPVPDVDPDVPGSVAARVVEIAGRLAAKDSRFADWATKVGVSVDSVKLEAEKQDLIHELDACVACLYGLDEDDLYVLYTTFSEKIDYSERLTAVLEHFRRLT